MHLAWFICRILAYAQTQSWWCDWGWLCRRTSEPAGRTVVVGGVGLAVRMIKWVGEEKASCSVARVNFMLQSGEAFSILVLVTRFKWIPFECYLSLFSCVHGKAMLVLQVDPVQSAVASALVWRAGLTLWWSWAGQCTLKTNLARIVMFALI